MLPFDKISDSEQISQNPESDLHHAKNTDTSKQS